MFAAYLGAATCASLQDGKSSVIHIISQGEDEHSEPEVQLSAQDKSFCNIVKTTTEL